MGNSFCGAATANASLMPIRAHVCKGMHSKWLVKARRLGGTSAVGKQLPRSSAHLPISV